MTNDEYLSVKEFARRANVSRQTVYNALQDKLTEFVKNDVKGHITISVKGLELFLPPRDVSNLTDFDSQKLDTDSQKLDTLTAILQDENTHLREEIAYLRGELEKKDIAIKEKDTQLFESAERFAKLAEQAQTLATQAQTLHAADLPQIIGKAGKTEGETETPKKRGLLRRIFNGKEKE